MAFRWFRRKKQQPQLVPEAGSRQGIRDIETLKAGKLASLALDLTDSLLRKHGPRPAGSDACRSAAADLADAMHRFCPTIMLDDFLFHIRAIDRPLRFCPVVYIVSLLLLWVGLPLTSTALLGLFVFLSLRECLLYKPALEFLSKSDKGRNVSAVIEPEGEVTDTLIFSAHHDSARIYRYNRGDKLPYFLHVHLPFSLCALLVFESVVQLFTEIATGSFLAAGLPSAGFVVSLVLLSLGTPLVWGLRRLMSGEASPGAGDNLVSSCMTVELARYFDWKKRCAAGLHHTRLIFASFDGEEAGLRGSRQWFRTHKDLLVNARMLNIDCPYYADQLKFLNRDINGTMPLSAKLASSLVKIARSMGYSAETESIPLFSGGTDAAEGERAGIEACTLTAVAWGEGKYPFVAHSADDTVDAIEKQAIERAISLAIRLAELVDEGRLDEESGESEKREEGKEPDLKFTRLP